ncbi:unnamed protein product [Closterium sp. NIES-64]|nr:unnamed protein product [Closterium sp. NIES-64]
MLHTVGRQEVGGKLTTPVRVQTQDRKVQLEPLAELETSSADPRDQSITDLTLGAQGEDRGVARIVVDDQQESPLVALSTDVSWAPHVQVESLQGSLCGRERGGMRSGALAPLDTGKTGRSRRGWEGRENPGKTRDKRTRGGSDPTGCRPEPQTREDSGGGRKDRAPRGVSEGDNNRPS